MKEIKKTKLITKIQKMIDEHTGEENEVLQDVYEELRQKNEVFPEKTCFRFETVVCL